VVVSAAMSGTGTAPTLRPVALVGLPGSGKSTVGRALAARLGWRFADTDALVEEAAGQSVASIFASEGEDGFRERERAALARLLDGGDDRLVVACGGGLVTHEPSLRLLESRCLVVWLDGDDDTLLARLARDGTERPLLRDRPAVALADLRRRRAGAYGRAHLRVDAGGSVAEVARSLVRLLAERGATETADPVVTLGARSYPVLVAPGIVERLPELLPRESRQVAVVADRAVATFARAVVADVRRAGRQVEVVWLAGGEAVKTWAVAGRVLERLAAVGMERSDCLVAVGGGSVGDLAGFVASAYHRGIAYLQVPTTLLAMVDSAIGGKTGVNLGRGKNLAGAFWQPRAVLCDLDVLGGLPERPYRAAFAEIVKYGAIADAGLVASLEDDVADLLRRDLDALSWVVRRCASIKAGVVADDEREGGRRAILNYGHTVGHALEACTGYSDVLLHGEAVACGMRVAGQLSTRLRDCPPEDVARQDDLLARFGLGRFPAVDPDDVIAACRADKKARQGAVRWVLLERLGEASPGHLVADDVVRECLVAVARS
jgi:shikimate kinase/3-dehydroquinate synthase